ncbi:MAG: LytR/AlgR family response regulator transcription factor [Fervidobacterium sp.]|uniref:LytR/AlgR family response regulator transcription factor n=1 Tax=Fervidobacterium sp. TaxID=1871331 RepID=UPI00404921CE
MITYGIVDDDPVAIERVERLIGEIDSTFQIVFKTTDCSEFVKCANLHKPDVLFLDINISEDTIFGHLERLNYEPHIVFITAYDEYLLKAFEEGAIDYILKPISKERLTKTIERIKKLGLNRRPNEYYVRQMSKLPVKQGESIILVDLKDIIYLEADDKIIKIFTEDETYETSTPLHTLEQKLPSDKFVRIHKSYIVSVEHIVAVKKWFQNSYIIVLSDNAELKLSRNYQEEVFKRLGLKN